MNGTVTLYSPGQQAALSLAPLSACPLLAALIYYLARRRRMKVDETLKSRAYLFYRFISALLLGQVLCHTEWSAAPWMVLCVAGGYFLLDAAEGASRVWNDNAYFIGPADYEMDGELGLNRAVLEVQNTMVSDDVNSEEFAHDTYEVERDYKDNIKRQWVLMLLVFLLLVVSMMDGFLLIIRDVTVGTVAAFYVAAISMSLAVYGAMIHAKYHITEKKRKRLQWWIAISALWCLGLFFTSCMPLLVGMQLTAAQAAVSHTAFIVFYGLAAGALLKIQQYFHYMKQQNVDRWDTFLGMGVFLLALGQSAATSMFL